MISRKRLNAVKAKYRESDKRKIILACVNMEKYLNDEDHLDFHNRLEELKSLIRNAESNAEINYFVHKD